MNLDEFEGHTPGPWKWSEEQLSEYVPQSKALLCVFEGEEMEVIDMWLRWIGNDANKALIAAAPDLLAEVKRLREGIKQMAENREYNSNPYLSDALKELIE